MILAIFIYIAYVWDGWTLIFFYLCKQLLTFKMKDYIKCSIITILNPDVYRNWDSDFEPQWLQYFNWIEIEKCLNFNCLPSKSLKP